MRHVCDGADPACLGCVVVARRHANVVRVLTLDDELDPMRARRMWARLDDRLAAPRWATWSRIVVGLAAAAVVATAIALVAVRRGEPEAVHVAARPAPLGPHTNAALVGDARVAMIGEPGDATHVRVEHGTVLADFTGGPGRALRIEAPGLVADVVGTLFAVEVRGATSCVAVTHGRVRVAAGGAVALVDGGHQLCSDDARLRPIAPALREQLEDHAVRTASTHARPTPVARTSAPVLKPEPVHPAAPPRVAIAVAPPPPSPVAPPSPVPSRDTIATPSEPPPTTATTHEPAPASRESPATTHAPQASPTSRESPATMHTPPSPPSGESIATHAPPASSTSRESLATTPGAKASEPLPTASREAPAAKPRTAEDHYRDAEAALRARDPVAADRALAQLVTAFPASPLADQATYERARIAYQQRAWDAARRHLAAVVAQPGSRFVEPARYLGCRIAVETRDGAATRCLIEYRAHFPRSPHDAEALALLAQLAHGSGGCFAARSYLDELAATHPRHKLTTAWRSRCEETR